MKKFITVTGALLLSFSAIANEPGKTQADDGLNQLMPETMVPASEETVKAMTETCQSWAKEDGVQDSQLTSYLLDCVNNELEKEGFLPVSTLHE